MVVVFHNYSIRLRETKEGRQVFDPIRKKYVILSPEEWVRQHWVHYLIEDQGISANLCRTEMSIRLNGLLKRCDIVVFNQQGEAQLIIECKAGHVTLDQSTVDQASRYNLKLKVPFLIISNGQQHYGFHLPEGSQQYQALDSFPILSLYE